MWYADIDFKFNKNLPMDAELEALEILLDASPAISVEPSRRGAGVSLALAVSSAEEATMQGLALLQATTPVWGEIQVTSIRVVNEDARRVELLEPSFPELVGIAEIADIAGVSRTRARELTFKSGFPAVVVETSAGALRTKASVQVWVDEWKKTKSVGRPRKVA